MTKRVLVVTVEPLWPSTHGGRVRTARIVETLAGNDFDVRVVFPDRPGNDAALPPQGVEQVALAWSAPSRVVDRLRRLPWLGVFSLGRVRGLQDQVDTYKPDFIYWSHSYLAAVGRRNLATSALQIVEFANIERERFLSVSRRGQVLHRLSATLEFLKACFWERNVIRCADLCVSISEADERALVKLGGSTVTVENALPRELPSLSPDNAVVVSVANWEYGPNRDGINFFLTRNWPTVVQALPHAKLVLAGKGSDEIAEKFRHLDSIAAVGFVENLTNLFRDSSLFLAPARSGAGRQLKVAEALGHARAVVGPPFLRREHRSGLPIEALSGSDDVAGEIVRRIENREERHVLERQIAEYAQKHDWEYETAALRSWMNGRNG